MKFNPEDYYSGKYLENKINNSDSSYNSNIKKILNNNIKFVNKSTIDKKPFCENLKFFTSDKLILEKQINLQSEISYNNTINNQTSSDCIKNIFKILRMSIEEIKDKLINITSNNKEYAIFFLNNSQINEEIKEKIKSYEFDLKQKFDEARLLRVFQLFLDLSENADPKFKEYLFKLDEYGYNITHYASALSI